MHRREYSVTTAPAYDFPTIYKNTDPAHHWYIDIMEFLVADRERIQAKPCLALYFLQSTKTMAIKIGIARNVKKRVRALERASGFPMKILYEVFSASASDDEKSLHGYWDQYRLEGEWFVLPTKLTPQGFVEESLQWLNRRHAQITMVPSDDTSGTHDPGVPYQRQHRRRRV